MLWLLEVKKQSNDAFDLNICIVEQDNTPKIKPYIKPGIEYIFVYNSGLYNRGWAFNIGFQAFINSDYFFFADNDIILPIKDTLQLFKECNNYDAVNPYYVIYNTIKNIHDQRDIIAKYWDGEQTLQDIASCIKCPRSNTCLSGGIMGISKSAFSSISGWDERFRGRGYEDYAMTAKINLFLNKIKTFNFDALHIWHPLEINTSREQNELLNKEYSQYKINDYINLINNNKYIGSISKYCDSLQDGDKFLQTCGPIKWQCENAIAIYDGLIKFITRKHHCNYIELITLVYLNLSEQHNCKICCGTIDPPIDSGSADPSSSLY